jgi:hypothetical protein
MATKSTFICPEKGMVKKSAEFGNHEPTRLGNVRVVTSGPTSNVPGEQWIIGDPLDLIIKETSECWSNVKEWKTIQDGQLAEAGTPEKVIDPVLLNTEGTFALPGQECYPNPKCRIARVNNTLVNGTKVGVKPVQAKAKA